MYPRFLLILFVLIGTVQKQTQAQLISPRIKDVFRTHMEFGVHGGTAGYLGELNDKLHGFNSWSFGADAKYYFDRIDQGSRTWGVRLGYNYSNINGDDSESDNNERNFNFSNNIHEVNLLGEFNFWKFRPTRRSNSMTPYVFAGLGVQFHNPKADVESLGRTYSLIDENVQPKDGFTGKRDKSLLAIPFGGGFKYNLSGRLTPISLALELNYRYVFSDFIDGAAEGKYQDYNLISPKPKTITDQSEWEKLAGPHTSESYANLVNGNFSRGDRGNDLYMTAVFRITYTLYKYRDPLWR